MTPETAAEEARTHIQKQREKHVQTNIQPGVSLMKFSLNEIHFKEISSNCNL